MHHRLASNLVRCDLVLYIDSEIVIILLLPFMCLYDFVFLSLSLSPENLIEFVILCFIMALFVCSDVLDKLVFVLFFPA